MASNDESNWPPGTVRLIENDSEQDIILHPQPSDDPEDPLNWSLRRKRLALSCIIVYTITVAMPSGSVYSVVRPIENATELVLNDLNTGTGVMFLAYGWACVIWQPLALQYGKRPAYLASMVASIVIMGTAPLCTTRGTYLLNKVLQGCFGAPVESLCEISITDIYFSHERAVPLAFYGFALAVTGKLAPMLAGFINDGQSWRWSLWWTAIWIGFALIYCFFLMEETNYDRTAPVPPTPEPLMEDDSTRDEPHPEAKHQESEKSHQTPSPDIEIGKTTLPRKTYWQKLSLKDQKRPNRMFDIFLAPFKGFSYPVVVYAGLMYGANALVWSGVQNATTGTVYTTIHGFSTTAIAAAYSAGVVGVILGAYYSGKMGRFLTLRLARRRGGISEPEDTLYMFVASMVLVPFAMLLYGLGVTYRLHWFALVFSQGALAVSNALCVGGALGYAISSYHALSGDLITTLILIRNTLSFAVNYGITPWVAALGYRESGGWMLWRGRLLTWDREYLHHGCGDRLLLECVSVRHGSDRSTVAAGERRAVLERRGESEGQGLESLMEPPASLLKTVCYDLFQLFVCLVLDLYCSSSTSERTVVLILWSPPS
jgi:MFS family permease